MTRPDQLKRSADGGPTSRFGDFVAGTALGPIEFELTLAFIDEYMHAMGYAPQRYSVRGQQVVPPQLLLLYLMAILEHRYCPPFGIVMTELAMRVRHPVARDCATTIVGSGRIERTFERNGRGFVRWRAEFARADGMRVLDVDNVFVVAH